LEQRLPFISIGFLLAKNAVKVVVDNIYPPSSYSNIRASLVIINKFNLLKFLGWSAIQGKAAKTGTGGSFFGGGKKFLSRQPHARGVKLSSLILNCGPHRP
jgi:hypothetical protein